MIPFGSLLGGAIASAFGAQTAMFAPGAGSAVLALSVGFHPVLRGVGAPDEISIASLSA